MAESFYSGLRLNQNRPLVPPVRTPSTRRSILSAVFPCPNSNSNLTGSNGAPEIDQEELLRAYNELQRQNNGLLVMTARMSKEVQFLRKETQDVKDEVKEVAREISKHKQSEVEKHSRSKKLPKDLTVSIFYHVYDDILNLFQRKVRLLHSEQDPLHKFKGEEK